VPLIFIVIYALISYFFRNQYTALIFIVLMMILAVVSAIMQKRAVLEIQNNNLMLRTKSGDVLFMTSMKSTHIRRALWKDSGREVGPAVIFNIPDGSEISIGTGKVNSDWSQPDEEISKPTYKLSATKWDEFIQVFELQDKVMSPDEVLQKIDNAKKVMNKIGMIFLIVSIAGGILFFGLIYGLMFFDLV